MTLIQRIAAVIEAIGLAIKNLSRRNEEIEAQNWFL